MQLILSGPEEITFFHPKALDILDGALNQNVRSDTYDMIHPRVSAIFVRSEEVHKERRAVLEKALNPQGE